MNLLSTDEAAEVKGTSRQVIIKAIQRGEIDTVPVGKRYVVKVDKKFEQWQRSERHVQAAKTRWAKKEK